MEKDKYNGIERRSYFRVTYDPSERPLLQIDDKEFDVMDISEEGIRFVNQYDIQLNKQISGKLKLLNNDLLEITGSIEWVEGNQVGVCLKQPIPTAVIMREHRYVILNFE